MIALKSADFVPPVVFKVISPADPAVRRRAFFVQVKSYGSTNVIRQPYCIKVPGSQIGGRNSVSTTTSPGNSDEDVSAMQGYVSALWAQDWDNAEDSVYDTW